MQEAWKPRIEPKDKPPSPDRRMFLQALGGLAASAALAHESIKLAGIMLEQAMHTEESLPLRERILDGVVQIIEQSMRSPQMRDALNGKGKDPLALILNAARYPILPKHLDGTSYDVEPLTKKYQVQLGMLVDQGNHGQPPSNRISMRADPEAHERDNFLSVHDAGYGNGAYWDDMHLILTASHVLAMYFPEKKELSTEVIDIGLLRVPKKFAAHGKSEVIHDAGKLTDSDIHGSFAAISGTDPDETSHMDGRKIYPGIAIKITRPMAELILKSDPNIDPSTKVADDNTHLLRNRLEKSFMLVLPKNESKMNASSKTRPAMGMSGSSVFVKHDNKLQFGGVFWGAMQIEVGGEEFDIGFFHGIDEVREALKEKKVELLPNH